MTNLTEAPPVLKSASRCANDLDFAPRSHWPQGLPGIAINSVIIAGFQQKLVLDHDIAQLDNERIVELFHSIYPGLTFTEQVRLWNKFQSSKAKSWLPIEKILMRYQTVLSEEWNLVCASFAKLPLRFQDWCEDQNICFEEVLSLLIEMAPKLQFSAEEWIQHLQYLRHGNLQIKTQLGHKQRYLQ